MLTFLSVITLFFTLSAEAGQSGSLEYVQALKKGNLEDIKRFVKTEGVDAELGYREHKNTREDLRKEYGQLSNIFQKAEPIHVAAAHGHFEAVKYLAEKGGNLHCQKRIDNEPLSRSGDCLILYVAASGNLPMLDWLLNQGVDINAQSEWQEYESVAHSDTALTQAAASGHTDLVRLLLERGAEVNRTGEHGLFALHYAAMLGNVAMARELVNRGAALESENRRGQTPLCLAGDYRKIDMAKFLVSIGANPDFSRSKDAEQCNLFNNFIGSNDRGTILWAAGLPGAKSDKRTAFAISSLWDPAITEEMLDLAFNLGVNANEMEVYNGTALQYAMKFGNLIVAKHLIERGANINAGCSICKNELKDPPLLYALFLIREKKDKAEEILNLLIELKADLNLRPSDGSAFLVTLINMKQTDLAKKAVLAGVDVNLVDGKGETALLAATRVKDQDFIAFLLEHGAVDTADPKGDSPQHLAAAEGNLGLLNLFVEKGFGLNATNKAGESLLTLALNQRDDAMFSYLLGVGANVNPANPQAQSPLARAISRGRMDQFDALLAKGADLNAPSRNGSLLTIAIISNDGAILLRLLDLGASPALGDERNVTPISLAFSQGKKESLETLIQHEKKTLARDPAAPVSTSLHLACLERNWKLVKFLLENGYEVNRADPTGNTPFHYIVRAMGASGDMGVVRYVVETFSPDLNAKNGDGMNAIEIAIQNENFPLAKYLLDNKNKPSTPKKVVIRCRESASNRSLPVVFYNTKPQSLTYEYDSGPFPEPGNSYQANDPEFSILDFIRAKSGTRASFTLRESKNPNAPKDVSIGFVGGELLMFWPGTTNRLSCEVPN